MNLLYQLLFGWLAQRDARTGVDATQDHVTATAGLRPRFDPAANYHHARLAQDAGLVSDIQETEDDERAAEDALAEHADPRLLMVVLVGLFAFEFFSGIFISRSLGFEGPERIVVGLLLATAIFALTSFTAKSGSEEPNGRPVPERRPLFYGLLAAMGLLISALAIVRTQEVAADGETGSRAANFAAAVIAVACALGPAAVAELVMRARRPGLRALQHLTRARRRLRALRRRHDHATREIEAIATRGASWDQREAGLRAAYGSQFRRTRALLEVRRADEPDDPDPGTTGN